MNNEELQEKLEKYVRGKLPLADCEALENALRDDAKLREQLRLHRLALEADEYLLRQQLRNQVRQWVANAPAKAPLVPFQYKKWLGLILVVILGVVGIRWCQRPETDKEIPPSEIPPNSDTATKPAPIIADAPPKSIPAAPKQRYLAYVQANYRQPAYMDNAGGLRDVNSQDTSTSKPFVAGINAYQQGRYNQAIRIWSRLPATDEQVLDWRAHAYFHIGLETGNFSKAAALFQAMADRQTGDLAQDRAEWYLALSLLADYPKNQEKVNALLNKIAAQEYHIYREDAQKLIIDLATKQ